MKRESATYGHASKYWLAGTNALRAVHNGISKIFHRPTRDMNPVTSEGDEAAPTPRFIVTHWPPKPSPLVGARGWESSPWSTDNDLYSHREERSTHGYGSTFTARLRAPRIDREYLPLETDCR